MMVAASTFSTMTPLLLLLSITLSAVQAFSTSHHAASSRHIHSQLCQMTSSSATETQSTWTLEDLEQFSDDSGIVISFSTLGPGYRAVARAKHDESLIMGYVEGFVRPAGQILHLDKMEVFKKIVDNAKRQAPGTMDLGGISFGVGLLMGYRCLLHGT